MQSQPPQKAPRSSNIELFRIVLMLFIVMHHYVVNSDLMIKGGVVMSDFFSWRSQFLLYFGAWGKTGINCFVLITGYYMCQSTITLRKFLKLFLEIEFYNFFISLVFWVTGLKAFSLYSLVFSIWPIASISGNFVSCYLLFFFLIPFLNILIHNMTHRQHLSLLCVLVFMYSVIGSTFVKLGDGMALNFVSWFCVIYLIGSYIRLYQHSFFSGVLRWSLISMAILALFGLSTLPGYFIRPKWWNFWICDCYKPLAVLLSIAFFCLFKNVPLRLSPWINSIAASSFGVLLIHAHGSTMRQWLWNDTIHTVAAYHSPYMPLHAIGSVLAVYTVCTLLDMLRIRFLEKPFFRWYDRKIEPKILHFVQARLP